MARNHVICCDGTNNTLRTLTNIGRLSKLADVGDTARQVVYYDEGVGNEADERLRTSIGRRFSRWSGSAFGTGLVKNVSQAYDHLVRNYEPGDSVYMFGFSRGAYTVRVIAGLLNNYGLLRQHDAQEVARVVKLFQEFIPRDGSGFAHGKATAAQQARFDEAARIKNTRSVDCPVHFLGLFDTVSSLGWAWDPETFPNTYFMPNVKIMRHAMAIDERRAKFRTNRVRLLAESDCKQMWFAGVHSDVGGGYEKDNDLARIPLRWMLSEARKAGMHVNPSVYAEIDLDRTYLEDEQAEQHESLTTLWRALEYLPLPHWEKKGETWVKGKKVYGGNGWRDLPDTFHAHESMQRRKTPVKNVNWKNPSQSITFGQ